MTTNPIILFCIAGFLVSLMDIIKFQYPNSWLSYIGLFNKWVKTEATFLIFDLDAWHIIKIASIGAFVFAGLYSGFELQALLGIVYASIVFNVFYHVIWRKHPIEGIKEWWNHYFGKKTNG